MLLLLLTLGFTARALVRRARTQPPDWRGLLGSRPALFGAAVLAGSITHIVVGYLDHRYSIPLRWLALLLLSGVAASAVPSEWRLRFGAAAAALMLLFAGWAGPAAMATTAQGGASGRPLGSEMGGALLRCSPVSRMTDTP